MKKILSQSAKRSLSNLELCDGSHVAVIGGGPAGSFFSFFLLDMAERVGINIHLDIFEQKDFLRTGPSGCNHCGGIISETLIQMLAIEGINLPSTVVQRGIDSYLLHTDIGTVRIDTPLDEKRIAAVHRGSGPRGIKEVRWHNFDSYLQSLSINKGAHLIHERVEKVYLKDGLPQVKTKDSEPKSYDLLVVATGVNSSALKIFEGMNLGYKPPITTRTFICELYLGHEVMSKYIGSSMHIFLLDIPRLKFAALIPKGDYATICLLGKNINKELIQTFLNAPEVKQCLPPDWEMPKDFCRCYPSISIKGAVQPFSDRVVFIGDSGTTRLYKDGIGAAYRTAKAAARTAVFEGISSEDFRKHYWPTCKAISFDNTIGKIIFTITFLYKKIRLARQGLLSMVHTEQHKEGNKQRMSSVLWDTFTGSAPYLDVFLRALHPLSLGNLILNTVLRTWSKDFIKR